MRKEDELLTLAWNIRRPTQQGQWTMTDKNSGNKTVKDSGRMQMHVRVVVR